MKDKGSERPRRRAGRSRTRAAATGDAATTVEMRGGEQVKTALISGRTFFAKALQYSVVDGLAIFEGDIILGTAEEVEARTAQLRDELSGKSAAGIGITGDRYRWPDCTIPYTIDAAMPNQARVTDAINHWQTNTNYRFVLRTTQTAFVTFRAGAGGCSSNVGRQGNQQFVNLEAGCGLGAAIHEIGHVVGLWHEQSREDRDTFVIIHWDKIQPGQEHNFNQHIADGDDIGAYDYASIMHYPRAGFSIDGSDTITPVDATATIGQRNTLSAGDISAANSLCSARVIKPIKERILDTRWETAKELVKDIRLDTKKEVLVDTLKEQPRDTFKEQPFDTAKELIKERIKEIAFDPPKILGDPIGPINPVGPINPIRPVMPGPRLGVPFAVAAPHQAPAAQADLPTAAATLDTQLQEIAQQLGQLEAARAVLQAQYDETSALLGQAMAEHEAAGGS